VFVIFAISGGLIALAGLFGWFALPGETTQTHVTNTYL
jgi:hypothetical protein